MVASRSMRKRCKQDTSAFSCRDWQAVVYEIVGGRNCECLPREYHKKNYRGKHPRLRPSFDTLIIACQSRLAYALV